MQAETGENYFRGNRRLLRPRQMIALEEGERDGQQQQQQQQQREMTRQQQQRQTEEEEEKLEEVFCRKSTGDPIDDIQFQVQGNASSTSNEFLLSLTLAGAGIDLCSDDEEFPFQHFQYLSPETETGDVGWHVNCCDSPQEPGRQYQYIPPVQKTLAPTEAFDASKGLSEPDVPILGITTEPTNTPYDPTADGQVDFFPFAAAQVFVSSVAAFFSLAMILAMTLPLFKKRRRKRASTYNLYLVFLAVPDLIYNLFLLYLFATYQSDDWVTVLHVGEVPWMDHPYDLALFATCAAANLYMNAIIALEILKLLRNSKRRKRSKAPTLKKACLQALCTYIIGAAIFLVDFFGEDLKAVLSPTVISLIYLPIAIFIPISILLWVCFRIYWEGLIGDVRTKAGKRLTILIRYFTRIIVVYICIWIPAVIFYTVQFFDEQKEGLYYYVACVLYAMSAWANFALSLTKPDVRKNFGDLFTGRVCLPDPKDMPEIKKFTFSGHSNDNGPKEKRCTTSTGEETTGVKPHADCIDEEKGCVEEPEQNPVRVKINGIGELHNNASDSDKDEDDDDEDNEDDEFGGRNSNIFDFSGADAPRVRAASDRSNISTFALLGGVGSFMNRFSVAPKQKRNSADDSQLRSTSGSMNFGVGRSSPLSSRSAVRSASVLYSSYDNRSVSEPFEIHSTSFQEMNRRASQNRTSSIATQSTMRDASDDPSRSGSARSNDDLTDPKKPPSMVLEGDEEDEERPSNSLPARSKATESDLSGKSTGAVSFFMDKDSARLDQSTTSKMSVTTAFFMDISSSRSVPSTISSPTAYKSWIKGMKKNIKDMARLLRKTDVSDEQKTVYEQSINLKRRALQSVMVSRSPVTSERSNGRLSTSIGIDGARMSEVSELTPANAHDDSSSDGSESEIFGPPDRSDNSNESEKRYSAVRWVSELRLNIHDLRLRLEQEDLGEEERAMVSRAIESQKMTLASIENIGEGSDGDVFSSLRTSIFDDANNPKSVDHSNNSAFVASPLEVIDDNSVCGDSENFEQ